MSKSRRGGPRRCVTSAVSRPDYALRALDLAVRLRHAAVGIDPATLLHEVAKTLGVDRAVHLSFVRDDAVLTSFRFWLACDDAWHRRYVDERCAASDPWVTYALHHDEPVVARSVQTHGPGQRRAVELANAYGFVSTVLVPVHPVASFSRLGLLCLGSSEPDFFGGRGVPAFMLLARMFATEFNSCCLRAERQAAALRRNHRL